jgi:hypothetical protein
MHRVHVQGDNVQTWVKVLPVHAHFVTEVASFNVPKIPRVRLVTKWLDKTTGQSVVFAGVSTTTTSATVVNDLLVSTTTATTSLQLNPEYTYIQSVFDSAALVEKNIQAQKKPPVEKQTTFNVPTSSARVIIATTTKINSDFALVQKADEVVMKYTGDSKNIPYYYCVQYQDNKQVAREYGLHVAESIAVQIGTSTKNDAVDTRVCRTEIRIDRLQQNVDWFDFYPESTDLVLVLLQDGLYVVEVDDRAWQNTQLLYPGTDLEVVIDGERIFVAEGEQFLEVETELSK